MVAPALVKQLRDQTGVGMTKCKEALEKTDGNMEEAVAFLRKAGLTSASKKEGRSTKEGMVAFHETNDTVAIVEVDAETDFVVKNEKFQEFCATLAQELALVKTNSLDEFLQQPYSKDAQLNIDQLRSLLIQTIGENIQIRRILCIPKNENESIGIYSHMGGKILSVVVINGVDQQVLARHVAMHAAATAPQYLCPEEVPQENVRQEEEIAREQIKGKPEHIIEQILQGKLRSFYEMICLVKQKYIRDDSLSVEEFVAKEGKESGQDLRVTRFLRWVAGQ